MDSTCGHQQHELVSERYGFLDAALIFAARVVSEHHLPCAGPARAHRT